ncbi:MAG: PhoH family protein [Desulfomicrobiaceae bacterium]|nr:PhoH family protein [Desulfomicrobiaceae bacterium]
MGVWQRMEPTVEREIRFGDADVAREVCGPGGAFLETVAGMTGLSVSSVGATVRLAGEDTIMVDVVAEFFAQVADLVRAGYRLFDRDVEQGLRLMLRDPKARLAQYYRESVFVVSSRKSVMPKTGRQREYIHALRESDLTLGIGPAGTGKTYLAVAVGVWFFLQKRVKRLVLTRPAVEAGEKLGFLHGDLVEKVNPYLRPLYDALHDMLDPVRVQEMMASGSIEIAPLAFMRGRTLNDAYVILDEAQNTTPEQMKMFLTRLGYGSRAVVTGDVTQIDLPGHVDSGLVQAITVLRDVPGVAMVHFDQADVIRHPLVGRIVQAYERHARSAASDPSRSNSHGHRR